RLLILSAGSLMNLFLPILLFTASLMTPHDVPYGRAVITKVEPEAPAAEAGLQTGDIIYSINGRNVRNVPELSYNIRLHLGQTITMQVRRGQGQFLDIPVYARWSPPANQGPTGIEIRAQHDAVARESLGLPQAVAQGARSTFEAFVLIRNELVSWVKGAASPQVAGPVGIAQATGEVVQQGGLRPLLDFTAFLSINLAIINLLPLPMLDGGRIMFVLLEILRRGKRIAPEKEGLIHLVGFALILALAVIITYFDVLRLIGGESFFR
ncbi:MAG TPA: M50 family metallopeptidase, partial [Dehalococcoidia bacterium]|nr:M50 family metallopeptidase [Dehalococcoidia bacterium]